MYQNDSVSRNLLRKRPDLTPTEKLVALAILSYRNLETGECFQNQLRISLDTGFTREQVNRSIQKLKQKKVLKVKKQKLPSSRREVRNYVFLFDLEAHSM